MISRDIYLERLKDRMHNGSIKVITGIRRCGKSVLLFDIFGGYLREQGVPNDCILCYKLDNIRSRKWRDAEVLYDDIVAKSEGKERCYVFLDEVQEVEDFSELMNSLSQLRNLDVYVTGSNSRFLSTDILTEFRGRGDEVRVYPLTFAEFYGAKGGDRDKAWDEYHRFGGMPALFERQKAEQKAEYLKALVSKVYLADIVARNRIQYPDEMDAIFDLVCSAVGSLTNPKRIANALASVKGSNLSVNTVRRYLDQMCDAFLFETAKRYDVKGRRYFDTPQKYYAADVGLRNARLNFRQIEENHIMENVIFNELRVRGFSVDVGIVDVTETEGDVRKAKKLEVDFIATKGAEKFYIQSAYEMATQDKLKQEKRSLVKIDDSFRKIIVVKDNISARIDDDGIVTVGLLDFLLKDLNFDFM